MERAMAAQGLTTIRSSFGPQDTMDWLEAAVKAKGMTVLARIDHAAGAAGSGLSLRPTAVLMFGNAKAGTPLMQSVQTIGIDLPLKALVWQDMSGKTWLSYNDPAWLAQRHGRDGDRGRHDDRRAGRRRESRNGGVKNRHHFIWPSSLAAPLPVFDSRSSASRPPAA
jgi:uncharacterized protein (DUF302 family)